MLNNILKTCAVFTAVNFCTLGVAGAATVTIETLATSAQETVYGIRTDTVTRSDDLVGALAHVAYVDGTEEDLTFQKVGYNVPSEVVGSGLDLSFVKSNGPIKLLASAAIASLEFFLAPVGSVFDIAGGGQGGGPNDTPGSKRGYFFKIESGNDGLVGNITATYSGIVNLVGNAAYGDLYTTMLIDFSGLEGGGFLGEMVFATDMDTLRYTSDLTPVSAVPLPAGLPLLIAGLGGLGFVGRRRKKAV